MAKDTAEKSTQEFLDNLKIEPKFALNDIRVNPSIAGRAANIAEQALQGPANPFHTAQNAAAQETKPKENPSPKTEPEPTAPKTEKEHQFNIRFISPIASYHFKSNLGPVNYMDGGAFDYNKLYQKPHDAAYYATYVPHYKSFNGIIPDSLRKYQKTEVNITLRHLILTL